LRIIDLRAAFDLRVFDVGQQSDGDQMEVEMKHIFFAVLALLNIVFGSQTSYAADVLPKFNIERNCKAETSESAGVGETMASCVEDEQRARGQLAPQWRTFAQADKTACIRATSIDGTPSYVELQICLENASDVRSGR
jgi:hypothetical protein